MYLRAYDNIMKLTPTEREILVYLLVRGDDSATNIAETVDRHPVSVRRSGSNLEDKDLAVDKGGNVFKLTKAGVLVAQDLYDESQYQFL